MRFVGAHGVERLSFIQCLDLCKQLGIRLGQFTGGERGLDLSAEHMADIALVYREANTHARGLVAEIAVALPVTAERRIDRAVGFHYVEAGVEPVYHVALAS